MTTTEDRLTDALNAAARTVTAPSLRPLEDHPAPAHAPADSRSSRRRWLAAVAAAAAVALIAGLVVTVSARLRTPPSGAAGAPPPYYVEVDRADQLVVRATATGQVTSVVPSPRQDHLRFIPRLAATAGRTFFVEATLGAYVRTRIYRFRVTAAGRVADLAPVPGATLTGGRRADQMAASPDGSRLALGLVGGYHRSSTHAELIVINTRTGARTAWAGGPAPAGEYGPSLGFGQLSWTTDGRELAYLEDWICKSGRPKVCVQGTGYQEIRALDPARGGGLLDSGRLLLRRPAGGIRNAVVAPDGSALTTVVVHDRFSGHASATSGRAGGYRLLTVARVPAGTGGRARILFRVRTRPTDAVWSFVPGHAGQFLILMAAVPASASTPTVNGWIAHSRLHPLPPAVGAIYAEVW